MHLVQLLLPLTKDQGQRFDQACYQQVSEELIGRFGGLTSYSRAPAHGTWEPAPGETTHDEVVVYEVMVDALDERWWADYRRTLERRFAQDELVIRAHVIHRL